MKKIITLCALLGAFCITPVFAGPFGIEKGMSLAQVKAVCKTAPEYLDGDLYIISPLKTHDQFDMYAVRIDDDYGVYWLKAVSRDIHTNSHGNELLGAFNIIVSSIEKTYGNCEKIDKKEGYAGNEPSLFMHALREGARVVAALWTRENESKLPDDISFIIIVISPHDYLDIGTVMLEYNFSNYDAVQAKADTVF
jgi:hypothetical protein